MSHLLIDVLTFSHGSVQSIQTGSPDATDRGIFEPFVKSAEVHLCRAIGALGPKA